jgi:hypothetical protein
MITNGDVVLDLHRYRNVAAYGALERANMELSAQLIKGPRFVPLLHHMAVTMELGMIRKCLNDKVFVDKNNGSFRVCDNCKEHAPLQRTRSVLLQCTV